MNNDINKHYNIKKTSNKPARFTVYFGNIPMSRPMAKQDALQWLALQAGELESDSIALSWAGMNSR